ncbi:MAG: circadian clock KaiB family protein [Pseudomonadota bacterium]|nr:circadian clock KaiB family protein [Pseudomonadota bacterium]
MRGKTGIYRFRLFVAGDAPNSEQAIANLDVICRAHLANRHEVEIVDVLRQPGRALEDNIIMTPTLVKLAPGPLQRIVGTLSYTQPVMECIGLHERAA